MLKKRINSEIPTLLYEEVRKYMFENRVTLSEVIRRGLTLIVTPSQETLREKQKPNL